MQTAYTYDGNSDLLNVTQYGGPAGTANPVVRSFQYDGLFRLKSSTNPESGTTSYQYDVAGNVAQKTDANGVITTYCPYDSLNRPTCKSYSDGFTPTIYYYYDSSSITGSKNTIGRLTSETTSKGSTILTRRSPYAYDSMGRVSSIQECVLSNCPVSATPFTVAYSYNYAGNVMSETNGVASQPITLNYNYDAADRLGTITSSWFGDANHPKMLFSAGSPLTGAPAYTPFGLQVAQLGVDGQSQGDVVSMIKGYDVRGRLASEIDNGDEIATKATTGSNGKIVISGAEQIKGATKATNTLTLSGSDPVASVSCVTTGTPPHQVTTTCTTTYVSGFILLIVDGQSISVQYGNGETSAQLASLAASSLNSTGLVTTSVSGSTITVTTVATGTAANFGVIAGGDTNFAANFATEFMTGGLDSSSAATDKGTVTVTVNGNAVSVPYGSGSTSTSLATAIASALNQSDSSFLTAAASSNTVTLASVATGANVDFDISTSTTYDSTEFTAPSYQLTATQMTGGDSYTGALPAYSFSGPSNGLVQFSLNGNMTNVTDSVMGTWQYNYDTLNRLTGALAASGTYAGEAITWGYDPFGNRTSQAVTPVGSAAPSSYSIVPSSITGNRLPSNLYDADGNVRNDGSMQYTYDANGHICAGDLDPHPTSMVQYIYDAEGNRVAKGNITGTTTATINGTNYTVASCDATTNGFALTNSYVVGLAGEQISELTGPSYQWSHTNVFAGGALLATYSGSDTYFTLTDWLGSKRAEVSAGGCASTYASFPYGDGLLTGSFTGIPACPDATEHHFTGKERDTESGLDYFGARYYASAVGRWQSPDWSAEPEGVPYATLTNPQSLNLYRYVANNPLGGVDVDGHDWVERLLTQGTSDRQSQDFQMSQTYNADQVEAVLEEIQELVAQQQVGNTTEGSLAKVLTNEDGSLSTPKKGDPQELVDGKTDLANAIYNNANLAHPEKVAPDTGTASAQDSQIMQGVVTSRENGGADPVQGRHYYGTSHNPNLKSRPAGNGMKGAAGREKVFAKFGPFHDSTSPKRQTYIYIYNAPGQQ
jgi:RHS repeat-associated protein